MAGEVRWGILSTARIGRALVRGIGLSPNGRVQAVASRQLTRAREFAKELGIPRSFGSYEELIHSGEIDVIYNPLPNSMHAEWTIKALEAGLPVLCEKPIAVDAAQAREMASAARRAGLPLAEAFMYRFHPVYDRILETLAEGAIGDVVSIHSAFCFRLPERAGNIRTSAELCGGALMDVGCYCVNVSRRIAGCGPVRAAAFARATTVDDTFVGLLEFPNGILASFECSIESHGKSGLAIRGTTGAITLDNPWFPGEEFAQFVLCRGDAREAVTVPGANCYRLEVEAFAQTCRTHVPLRWLPEDSVANMAVLDALRKAATEHAAIEVERP
ncbi:MAG TPA: Gfo/Idh/MocA family oxidoreductase [Candidatus Hydrogenedentes bacterium]|nr:Gfo/Idh/MocA family oxidoreductase [Candidatus Hydrogenedentota bacterium]HIJ74243.1 Gfo/Idh/MocA family oxidoreductase [Candidatus Hydrogenedentota bacterium]